MNCNKSQDMLPGGHSLSGYDSGASTVVGGKSNSTSHPYVSAAHSDTNMDRSNFEETLQGSHNPGKADSDGTTIVGYMAPSGNSNFTYSPDGTRCLPELSELVSEGIHGGNNSPEDANSQKLTAITTNYHVLHSIAEFCDQESGRKMATAILAIDVLKRVYSFQQLEATTGSDTAEAVCYFRPESGPRWRPGVSKFEQDSGKLQRMFSILLSVTCNDLAAKIGINALTSLLAVPRDLR